jgi:hypothetical protein
MESLYFSLSLDACLREAAPAKAGERAGARGASACAAVRVKMGSSPPFISSHQERGDLPEF